MVPFKRPCRVGILRQGKALKSIVFHDARCIPRGTTYTTQLKHAAGTNMRVMETVFVGNEAGNTPYTPYLLSQELPLY